MVTEMTGGYHLLPPLMLVSVVSIVLAGYRSIYSSQVRDRFHSPAHVGDLTINVLEEMKVGDVFHESSRIPCVSPGTTFPALRRLLLEAREATVPVVDAAGRLAGLVTAE